MEAFRKEIALIYKYLMKKELPAGLDKQARKDFRKKVSLLFGSNANLA